MADVCGLGGGHAVVKLSKCCWQGATALLKQELAELLETLLRLHAFFPSTAFNTTHGAAKGFREAAVSQLPLLLSVYGALVQRCTPKQVSI